MSTYLETTHRNVIWFKRAAELEELQMAPPFQRNPVWTERQKSYLIDTILRGYPIPEIYMQDLVESNATQKHILVDGQQRIRACLEYLEGQFELDPKQSPDFADLKFDELRDDEKQRIYEYRFVVRLLPKTNDPTLRDIFQRLNRNNVALNAQELRQATYWGPFIQSMNSLSDQEYIRLSAPRSVTESEESDLDTNVAFTEEASGDAQLTYPSEVVQYAAAVQRAASDLANRRNRARQLERILGDIWTVKQPGPRRPAKSVAK